ncbi:putative constituent of 66s pre-ribosomal particles [Erysiphe necator]|uniref:Putative constituent of 66s pre-ribosomal particles n=1 Tax=Uncinula necator TaxID=52586 RepID=A0A0B1P5H9_UNCNE|nr:putative constituent of 66s pre-ribosomal particles [Erysiphe necator]
MADASLKERLLEHAKSFDGLLSLIPAKHYYGKDNSEQWKKKKQTKEQTAAAQRAKLDPDSLKSAKDVMDERARKRKLEKKVEAVDEILVTDIALKEVSKHVLKQKISSNAKKQKKIIADDGPQLVADAHKHIKVPADPDLLRSRLALRIEALRAARKADGPDGRPARNRQELLEARRKKEELRRAHKKELRLKAKADEEAQRHSAFISARSTDSSIESSAADPIDNSLTFSRVSFADGQQMTDDLNSFKAIPRKRGPQDIATSLLVSEKKRQKLAGLDEKKRIDIEEKELWLNAKKRVHGEKLRNNTTLLKKTLKRKEKAKKKSESEWTERIEGVAKRQALRQKKREENLKQRRESKAVKGKGGAKKKSVKSKKVKVKSRPGFEGSFISGKRK